MASERLDVYRDKKILVTGHTGFKGSWLTLWLHRLGAKVIGYSLGPPTQPNLYEYLDIARQITDITGDVRDASRVQSVIAEHHPDFIFHLAAQSLVRRSYQEPRTTYDTNVMGTVNVLEAARITGHARVGIVITSDKCYENDEQQHAPFTETDAMGGHDPYSASKGCAELVTASYRRSFFNPGDNPGSLSLSSARAGNVIGGGDWGEDRLVPDCIRRFAARETIALRSPAAVRPWQYVLEPLSGYLLLGAAMFREPEQYGSAWNFGPGETDMVSVETIVKLITRYWGDGAYTADPLPHLREAGILRLDSRKAREILRWQPVYDVEEAVRRTVNWYRAYHSNPGAVNLMELTLDEIDEYAEEMDKRGNNG